MRKRWFMMMLWSLSLVALYGQAQPNPFEIQSRLQDTSITDSIPAQKVEVEPPPSPSQPDTLPAPDSTEELPEQVEDVSDTSTNATANPFEATTAEVPTAGDDPGPDDTSVLREDTSHPLLDRLESLGNIEELDRISNQNLMLGSIVLILLFLALLLALNRDLLKKAYRAIANDNYLRFLFREYKALPWFYWLFYAFFFINAGLLIFQALAHFSLVEKGTLILLLTCIGGVTLVYLVKHINLNIVGGSFPVEKEANLYGFVTMLINILLGVVLTPVNLVIAFSPPIVSEAAVWFGLAAVVLLYLFRQLKGLFISGRFLVQYQFHFFMYLCTSEIAPLLIIGKLALGKFGFQ